MGTRVLGMPVWALFVILLCTLWPTDILFILLSTEDKMVNESVPLQSFWFSPHWRGSPSPCMSVGDLQEADTEIK